MSATPLRHLLSKIESAHFEHEGPEAIPEEIAVAVCAFLNTDGGTVLVEAGPTATVDQLEEVKLSVTERITPRAFWSATIEHMGEDKFLLFEVPAGPDRPYVVNGRIYIRQGAASVAAEATAIRGLVGRGYSESERWERRLVPGLEINDLDADTVRAVIRHAREQRSLRLEETERIEQALTILSLRRDGQLTNAAEVLLGKRPVIRLPQTRVRAVVYRTDKGEDFLDSQIYEGHAFELMEFVFNFVLRHTPVGATFSPTQLQREERMAFPKFAVREGVVNAFVHRDYSAFEGGMSVSLYPNRLVIWNSGSLPEGIRVGDLLREHPSILRNPDIAHIFYLRLYMERVGRGTQKIVEVCKQARLPAPKWESDVSGVTLTLFSGTRGTSERLNLRQKKLLSELKPGEAFRSAEYCERLAVSERQGRRDLSDLERVGYLAREGEGPSTVFRRTDTEWSG